MQLLWTLALLPRKKKKEEDEGREWEARVQLRVPDRPLALFSSDSQQCIASLPPPRSFDMEWKIPAVGRIHHLTLLSAVVCFSFHPCHHHRQFQFRTNPTLQLNEWIFHRHQCQWLMYSFECHFLDGRMKLSPAAAVEHRCTPSSSFRGEGQSATHVAKTHPRAAWAAMVGRIHPLWMAGSLPMMLLKKEVLRLRFAR